MLEDSNSQTCGNPVVSGVPFCRRLRHSACGCGVTAEVGEAGLYLAVRRFFEAFDDECEDGHISVSLMPVPDGYAVTQPGGLAVLCGSASDAIAAYEFAVTNDLLRACNHVQIHCAGSVFNHRAVLALGASGAGKSSLALAWLAAGYPTLGDDVVHLAADGRAVPFKRLFKVSPEMLQLVGVDPATTPFWNAECAEAWYDPADGAGWADTAEVALVALCHRKAGARLSLRPVDRTAGLNALLHSLMETGPRAEHSLDILVEVVKRARLVEVTFESALAAASAITEYLQ